MLCVLSPHLARRVGRSLRWCGCRREKYWEYEYEEVVSPNLYNFDLWVSQEAV